MSSLDVIAAEKTTLTMEQLDHLHSLVADWQIVADLAFCDLVLWLPDAESKGFWAVSQIRPTTGPTTLTEDVVGMFVAQNDFKRNVGVGTTDAVSVRSVAVSQSDVTFARVTQQRFATKLRTAGALERVYLETSAVIFRMMTRGEYPIPGVRSDVADSLRVGDGFIRTDQNSHVLFASPNAMSAYRRLGLKGDLVGSSLVDLTRSVLERRPTDRSFSTLFGTAEAETEVESRGVSLLFRVIPLRSGGNSHGHVVLLRDVSELRLRERELVSKEATIREIHHRVKNNLQTVAALLRLQARRLEAPEARLALEEAERRIGSIALVHETLSQSFDEHVEFDDIADTLLRTIPEVGQGGVVSAERIGSFGTVSADVAMPLAMVLTELVQNAVEHAFAERPGRITVAVNRIRGRLRLRVTDNGSGLPTDFDPTRSLGLSIVTTLVESELAGTLSFKAAPVGGTTVVIAFEL